jgi:hypothetical protein
MIYVLTYFVNTLLSFLKIAMVIFQCCVASVKLTELQLQQHFCQMCYTLNKNVVAIVEDA